MVFVFDVFKVVHDVGVCVFEILANRFQVHIEKFSIAARLTESCGVKVLVNCIFYFEWSCGRYPVNQSEWAGNYPQPCVSFCKRAACCSYLGD